MNRDSRGRFVHGHTVAVHGWRGLVNKRFGGNEDAARAWWGCCGAYYYDQMCAPRMRFMEHPGQPEDFLARWLANPVNQEERFWK